MRVSIDTRTLKPGDIFIPVKGENFDGHDYVQEALKKGAQKVLDVDLTDFAKKYRKKLTCKVIAITGSAGKTTVKDMIYYTLHKKFKVARSEENQNNEIGVPLNILKADAETEVLILELAARNKGDIAHLTKIARPTHVVITTVGLTHLELFKTQRNIALTKSEIFQAPLKWEQNARTAFLNFKTPYYDLIKQKAEKAKYLIYPFEGENSLEQNFNLCYLVGRHFGLTDEEIQTGLEDYKPSAHRLDVIKLPNYTIIDDAYNANPDGVKYALGFLQKFNQRKIFVFGDMLELGSATKKEHQKIIDLALDAGVEIIFTYGPHTAMLKSKKITIINFDNKEKLTNVLKDEIKKDDVILIKGSRGMKMEEIVNNLKGNTQK